MWSKLTRWLIFTVVLSLLPLMLDFVLKAADGSSPSINEVISRGELCLVCTALAGVGLGELLGLSDEAALTKIVLGGACFLSAVISIALYIAMKATTGNTGSLYLDNLSWYVFAETVITSTVSVVVSEVRK
jgi:hypothetical protein